MNKFMKIAFKEAIKGMRGNEGGPFGAVIVKDKKIISKAHNKVIQANDPTAHAEITAIRKACKKLKKFDLSNCEIYSSCEPCPMCLSAIYWARIKKLYFGCTRKDASEIDFDDELIYDAIKGIKKEKQIEISEIDRLECLKLFDEWKNKKNKTQY
ncbi:MAG TPA: nucleoside deaminase [Candidatus Nanoarchaeia archaeon]|nr:nucleoside deaminase [Candidatus Nanoarchaeia archaeon]